MAGGERAARGNGGHRRGWPAGVVVREQRGRPLLMIRPRVWIRRPSGGAARSTSLRPRHLSVDSGSEVLVETQEGSRHA